MLADPEYLDWFDGSEDLVNWQGARQSLFQVY
jgi:hypothetical protein